MLSFCVPNIHETNIVVSNMLIDVSEFCKFLNFVKTKNLFQKRLPQVLVTSSDTSFKTGQAPNWPIFILRGITDDAYVMPKIYSKFKNFSSSKFVSGNSNV